MSCFPIKKIAQFLHDGWFIYFSIQSWVIDRLNYYINSYLILNMARNSIHEQTNLMYLKITPDFQKNLTPPPPPLTYDNRRTFSLRNGCHQWPLLDSHYSTSILLISVSKRKGCWGWGEETETEDTANHGWPVVGLEREKEAGKRERPWEMWKGRRNNRGKDNELCHDTSFQGSCFHNWFSMWPQLCILNSRDWSHEHTRPIFQ